MSILKVENLGKKFHSKWVFRKVCFESRPGDVVSILGPNGSGKSTLLKLIAGLMAPTEGKINRPDQNFNRSIGYSGLDLQLYPHLTAYEHLRLGAKLRGIESNVDSLLEKISLYSFAHTLVQTFSSGMKARLKLALAIQAKPKLLLLDEPEVSLDSKGSDLLSQIVDEQKKEGIILWATNDLSVTKEHTDKITLYE